jgi:hypothetical protein
MTGSATLSPPVPTIEPGRIYKLDDFLRAVGLGRHAYRTAVGAGLRVVRTHGRVYVRGDDWIAYIDAIAAGE